MEATIVANSYIGIIFPYSLRGSRKLRAQGATTRVGAVSFKGFGMTLRSRRLRVEQGSCANGKP